MNATLWVIVTAVGVMLLGLFFTSGWVVGRDGRDRTRLVQLVVSAGFVAVALTIIAIQVNIVTAHQKTVDCNTSIITALALRAEAWERVNNTAVDFHQQMLYWLNTEGAQGNNNDALTQSLNTLIIARSDALRLEHEHPVPAC